MWYILITLFITPIVWHPLMEFCSTYVPPYSVYSGHHTYIVNIYDLEVNPSLWLSTVSSHKIRDTYCSYAAIEVCCKELGSSTDQMKVSIPPWVCGRSFMCMRAMWFGLVS